MHKIASRLYRKPSTFALLGVFTVLSFVAVTLATTHKALAATQTVSVSFTIDLHDQQSINTQMAVFAQGKTPDLAVSQAMWSGGPQGDEILLPTGYSGGSGPNGLVVRQGLFTVPPSTEANPNLDNYQYRLCTDGGSNFCSDWKKLSADRDSHGQPTGRYYFATPFAITSSSGDGTSAGTYVESADGGVGNCQQNVSLGFLVCPILGWIDGAISGLEGGVMNLLTVDRLYGAEGDGLYKVWGTMRNIALIILIPMMLVMVLGTALDFGPFDAYTVKKALPRMVAAVIFIVLSWKICTFLIDLSDIVGVGTYHLITSVAGAGEDITLASLMGGSTSDEGVSAAAVFTGVAVGGYVAWALGTVAFGIIFSMALTVLMALFIGYLSLAIRLIIILGLLVFAPIFILSWIFPGNDKMWKFWKTTFMSMLLLFPIITGVIAIGKVGAYIVSQM